MYTLNIIFVNYTIKLEKIKENKIDTEIEEREEENGTQHHVGTFKRTTFIIIIGTIPNHYRES